MNPDGHAPDERDPASRTEFRVGTRNAHTGLTPFAGTFTDEGVEIFRQATFALAKPVPDDNGVGIRGHPRTGSPKHTSTCSAPTSTKALDPASAGTSRTSR